MEIVCRLCAVSQKPADIRCTIDNLKPHIKTILVNCCNLDVYHSCSNLTRSICEPCYWTLELFLRFLENVSRAQVKLCKDLSNKSSARGVRLENIVEDNPEIRAMAISRTSIGCNEKERITGTQTEANSIEIIDLDIDRVKIEIDDYDCSAENAMNSSKQNNNNYIGDEIDSKNFEIIDVRPEDAMDEMFGDNYIVDEQDTGLLSQTLPPAIELPQPVQQKQQQQQKKRHQQVIDESITKPSSIGEQAITSASITSAPPSQRQQPMPPQLIVRRPNRRAQPSSSSLPPSRRPVICPMCNVYCSRTSVYLLHVDRYHNSHEGFTCDYCGKKFNTKTDLTAHFKRRLCFR